MYKHKAESIMESSRKQFISETEKNKYDNYDTNMIHVEDSYNKNEIEEEIKKISDIKYANTRGTHIIQTNTKQGRLVNLEVFGNTVQSTSKLSDIKSVGKLLSDGNYELYLTTTGINIFDGFFEMGTIHTNPANAPVGSDAYSDSMIRSGYIRVNGNQLFNINTEIENPNIFFYDKDKTHINWVHSSKTFTTPNNCKYIRFRLQTTDLESEVTITPNMEYQHIGYNKSDISIILPCQLEKVGDIADRLFKREDGVWCIEKRVNEYRIDPLNGSWGSYMSALGDDLISLYTNSIPSDVDMITKDKIAAISDKLPIQRGLDVSQIAKEGIYIRPDNKAVYVKVKTSKAATHEELANYVSGTLLKYPSSDPQIIELPKETQLVLDTFIEGTIVYSDNLDASPTIVCDMPISISASIETLVKDTVDISNKIQNIAHINQDNIIPYNTESGYLQCPNTIDGTLSNIKIKGHTLKNLATIQNVAEHKLPSTSYYADMTLCEVSTLKVGTIYTIIVEKEYLEGHSTNYNAAEIGLGDRMGITTSHPIIERFDGVTSSSSRRFRYNDNEKEIKVITFKIKSFIDTATLKYFTLRPCRTDSIVEGSKANYKVKVVMLEGDYSKTPVDYFDGVMSLGESSKLSIVTNNNNLFSEDLLINTNENFITEYDNKHCFRIRNGVYKSKIFDMKFEKYQTYNFKMKVLRKSANGAIISIAYDDGTHKYYIASDNTPDKWVDYEFTSDKGKSIVYIYATFSDNTLTYIDIPTISVSMDNAISGEVRKSDIKHLLFNNSGKWETPILRKISDDIYDSIECINNKYFYNKRCGDVLITGDTTLVMSKHSESESHVLFTVRIPRFHVTANSSNNNGKKITTLNNRLLDTSRDKLFGNNDMEGISNAYIDSTNPNNNGIFIRLPKDRLISNDINGLRDWLSKKPLKLLFELICTEVYECKDITVNSYLGTTVTSLQPSNIIPANMTFNISSHIGSFITDITSQVEKLDKFKRNMTGSVSVTKHTNTGYMTIEHSKKGVIRDIKIRGKSLHNLVIATLNDFNSTMSANSSYVDLPIYANIKPNTEYTVISYMPKFKHPANMVGVAVGYDNTGANNVYNTNLVQNSWNVNGTSNIHIEKFTTPNLQSLNKLLFRWIRGGSLNLNLETSVRNGYIIVLEGDHANIADISYFQGIKSVFEGDTGPSLYVRNESLNIFDKSKAIPDKYIDHNPSSNTFGIVPNLDYAITDYIPIDPTQKYCTNIAGGAYYDTNKLILRHNSAIGKPITIPKEARYMILAMRKSTFNNDIDNVYVTIDDRREYKNDYHEKYISYIDKGESKIPILRSLPDGTCDRIEQHSNGKYYYHKCIESLVITGHESSFGWQISSTTGSTICLSTTSILKDKAKAALQNDQLMCDTLNVETESSSNGKVGILLSQQGEIRIELQKSTASTLNDALQWLQNNNTTIQFALTVPEIYELTNIDLYSYSGSTFVMVKSGPIIPEMSITLDSNIANYVKSTNDRIKSLEYKLTSKKISRQRLQLNTTYSSDKTTFDVDTSLYSESISGVDIDLFELTKSVISVGIKNYDIMIMEELIDFYTMVGKFNYDMAGILFDIIGDQTI